jgi:hypothetical protein
MTTTYTLSESGLYQCDECEWVGSRSGFYKHRKIHAEIVENDELHDDGDSTISFEPADSPEEEESSWMDWGDLSSDESATDHMPTPLKALNKKAGSPRRAKRTKAELESARATSKSLITLGLTFTDTLLSIWGRGQLLDPDFKVQHTDRDKEITSDAVVGAMEEKGLYLSDAISRTTVASVMLTWYVGAPVYRIQKKSQRGLFKGGRGSGLLARIPLIGRLFKRKKKTGLTVPQVEAMNNEG